PEPARVRPVRIRRGAFGPGLPRRALHLSPDHAVYANGVLIPVKYLIDGDAVAQETPATVTYFHIELDSHDVVLAEGLPVESYLDVGDRAGYDHVAGSHVGTDAARRWESDGYAPLVCTGPVIDALRRRLRPYAGTPGRRSRQAVSAFSTSPAR
ncbi:Hint domain-containing protein, partial [Acidisphaera rubrifaciens]|uniref:Hint domain-containing protein n=1 Tax=Acidisphaera rubrifaciens TaxID=50715 RepID=UPI0018F13E68